MNTVVYRIDHFNSKSVALLEFAWKNGRVELISFAFAKGNVVDINQVRKYKEYAKAYFLIKDYKEIPK